TVAGKGCGEVVEAISVMAAIVFGQPAASASPDEERANAPPPSPPPPPASRAPEPEPESAPVVTAAAPAPRWRGMLGVTAGASVLGGVALAGGGFVDVERQGPDPAASGWWPAGRVG